jgi:hypothetical protein
MEPPTKHRYPGPPSSAPSAASYARAVFFATPERCALAGYPATSGARAAAAAYVGDCAAVLVVTAAPNEHPFLVTCVHTDGGWQEVMSGTGDVQWTLRDQDSGRGVLSAWGRSRHRSPRVRVAESWHAPSVGQGNYWTLVVEDVLARHADHIEVHG